MATTSRIRPQRVGALALGLAVVAGAALLSASPAAAHSLAEARTVNAADEDAGSDWWWLLIPFLLILAGLLIVWLVRRLRLSPAEESTVVGDGREPDEGAAAVETEPAREVEMATAGGGVGGDEATVGAEADAEVHADVEADVEGDAEADVDADAEVERDVEGAGDDEPEPAPGPESLDELMNVDIGEVMSPPADAELGVGDTTHHGSGDGVGSYHRNGEELPVPLGAHLPVPDTADPPDGYPIKADADAGVYHTPDLPSYADVAPEIWFASESAAEAAHFRKADAV